MFEDGGRAVNGSQETPPVSTHYGRFSDRSNITFLENPLSPENRFTRKNCDILGLFERKTRNGAE